MSSMAKPWSDAHTKMAEAAGSAADTPSLQPIFDHALETVEDYAREKPWNFGLAMLGLGFILGWKLKFF